MSAYPDKLKDGRDYVMRRIKDGRYMCVSGWSVEWSNIPTRLCPLFRLSNMGPGRYDDWHRQTYARFRSLQASQKGMKCELVPYNERFSSGMHIANTDHEKKTFDWCVDGVPVKDDYVPERKTKKKS